MIEQDAIFWYNKMKKKKKKEKRTQASWRVSSFLRTFDIHISEIYFGFLFHESIRTSDSNSEERETFLFLAYHVVPYLKSRNVCLFTRPSAIPMDDDDS